MSLKRLLVLLAAAGAFVVLVPAAVGSGSTDVKRVPFNCEENGSLCTEIFDNISDYGYVGHDEPSLLFYSNRPGSGNNQLYHLTLPTPPPRMPNQSGTGGTWDFQLHIAFWLGMAMCDDQSAPNPGGSTLAGPNVPCQPDSDSNVYTGTTPGGSNYIGQHPGTAFMEMQFYPPGWSNLVTDGCDATRWCAALTIDSLSENLNTGAALNETCQDQIFGGVEYVNFAYITLSGVPLGPPNPLDFNASSYTPDLTKQLLMNSGDKLAVEMHDTPAGFQVIIHDLTTGQTGSMTASAANHFGVIQYAPTGTGCTEIDSAFHPEYSTSSENTRVVWAAHSYNVAYSDEIGHWEYCNAVDLTNPLLPCTQAGVTDSSTGLDGDDFFCAPASTSLLVQITGCTDSDEDFDGPSYLKDWPGARRGGGRSVPTPIEFQSPTFNGGQNYSRVAFETDLPRIEAADSQLNPPFCDRTTGANCVNPPPGAQFYPMYVTRYHGLSCTWDEGGPDISGFGLDFGGEQAEYGGLLTSVYPSTTGVVTRINNFHRTLPINPCPTLGFPFG